MIVKALYRLKSSSASWRVMFVETLGKYGLGYTSTAAYKDVWIKREVLLDREEYQYMVLVYVGDILCIHKDTLVIIDALTSICVIGKHGTAGPLLGSKHRDVVGAGQ